MALIAGLMLIAVAFAAYAVPALAYMNGTSDQIRDRDQDRLRDQTCNYDCLQTQDQTRTQLRLQDCTQNQTCTGSADCQQSQWSTGSDAKTCCRRRLMSLRAWEGHPPFFLFCSGLLISGGIATFLWKMIKTFQL